MPRCARVAAWVAVGLAERAFAAAPADSRRLGSLRPRIDEATWEGWEPSANFTQDFLTWPDKEVPDEVQVWCKGFIPDNATTERVGGYPVVPILGPGGIPIPGLLGKCAATDGRSWSTEPPASQRPTDARFWGVLSVAKGRGKATSALANCGESHNICCRKSREQEGCWDGSKYGEITCTKHCPDSEMKTLREACWSVDSVRDGHWTEKGVSCRGVDEIAAAKVYVQGRGGNPCGEVMGVKPPKASWDVGLVVFPTKRKVTVTGYVDDAPSYECYARAKDGHTWGPVTTLVQVPMSLDYNIAIELAGYSDRPINPQGLVFDLPDPLRAGASVVV